MYEIIPPENCPSCNSTLEWRNDVLYCISNSCSSKTKKSIEHWAKALKIKGLGPQTIDKLDLSSICDLYYLSPECLKESLGSEKLANKLYSEIQNSKLASLNRILPAFGIPLIGNSASQKICSTIESIDELTVEKAKLANLGPTAIQNLMEWFNDSYLGFYKEFLGFEIQKSEPVKNVPVKGIVCISGKLKSFKTKKDAEQALTSSGYLVKSSVTKDVTILINESGIESAKTEKARRSGVTIINNLNQFLGD